MVQRKITYIIFILFSFNNIFGQSTSNDTTRIDASLFIKTGQIELKGECDFYWQQLLNPDNIELKKDSSKLVRISIPNNWTNYSLKGKKLPAFGYGTYHIVVENPYINQAVYIQMKTVLTSYKLWINDTLLGSIGKVGTQKNNYTAKVKPTIYEYFPKKDDKQLHIIIQVSNYVNSRAGITEEPILFKFEQLEKNSSQKFWDAIVFGMLMIIAVYFFIIHILNNRDKASLWLAIFAVILGIRSGMINSRFLPEILPFYTSFPFQIRLEYFSAYSNIALVALFFHHLFDKIFRKTAIKIIVGLGILFSLFILFAPVYLVTKLRDLYNLYLVLSGLYVIFFPLLRAVIKGTPDAIPAFAGMFVMLFTAILDVLTVIFQLPIPQLAPWGLVTYVIFQAFVVSHRFSAAFNENIDLSSKLAYQNENLEHIVDERTDELRARNEELLAAEEELRQNNEELNVLNENISRQKDILESANKSLIGQAVLSKILQKVTNLNFSLDEFLNYTLTVVLELPWLNVLGKGAIFIVNKDGNLEMVASKNIGELNQRCKIIKPNECLCGKALSSKENIFCDNITEDHEITFKDIKPHGHYNLPLVFKENVMGVLNIYVEPGHNKSKEEIEFLQILSNVLASIIHRKGMQDEIDIKNRKLVENNKELKTLKNEIEQKEEQLQRIIENQGEGFALIGNRGEVLYANSSALRILRVKRDIILKMTFSDFWSAEEQSKINKKINALKADENINFETYINTSEGETIFIQSTLTINRGNSGNKIGYIVNFRDITEKRKAEIKIAEQHKDLTLALRKINDSINYAKKLQKALLSPLKLEQIFGKNNSHLFLPRDIVSGDFYFADRKNNWITFAVGDCTGHGVPGAFLSVLSYSILNDIIHMQKEIDTALTLEIMRIRMKQVFSNGAKDGLDIALCAINTDTRTLYYSGAYNPLVLLRDGGLIEKRATYNPIGHYAKEQEFEKHEIKLQDNDVIYLFSDGYVDQFGGANKRKFMRQRFYSVLKELDNIPIENHSKILQDIFIKWKGEIKQVDDISILGIEWSDKLVK